MDSPMLRKCFRVCEGPDQSAPKWRPQSGITSPENQRQNLALTALHVPYCDPALRAPSACFRSLICTGPRRNPATCGTNQGNWNRVRVEPALSARDHIAFHRSLICTGARHNPAACGTNKDSGQRRFHCGCAVQGADRLYIVYR